MLNLADGQRAASAWTRVGTLEPNASELRSAVVAGVAFPVTSSFDIVRVPDQV